MAGTFCPVTSRLAEFAIVAEAAYSTFQTPFTAAGGVVQISHRGVTWGRNHAPIDGSSAHGTTQNIITDRTIRGVDAPAVDVTLPLRDDSIDLVMEILLGGTKAAGTWPISDSRDPYSIGIHDTIQFWQFAGCLINTASITMAIGAVTEVQMGFLATSLVSAAPGAFPALTPSHANRPYVLTDCTLTEATTAGGVAAGTAIPFRGATISIARNVIVDQANSVEPNCLTPSTFDVTGTIDLWWSSELNTELGAIIADDAGGGYSIHYLQFRMVEGARILNLVLPVRLDIANFVAPVGDGPVTAPINFFAAGDDGTPTTATILATDS